MAAADQAVHRCEESQRAYDHLSMATSTSCTCTSAGSDQSTGVEFDFSAALLSHHLDNIDDESSGNRDGGEDDVDFGKPRSLFESIKNLGITSRGLATALSNKLAGENVNDLRPYDDRDELGHLSVLHRLVTRPYIHQVELVVTLITFSDVDINMETSKKKTAFHLAVELVNIEVMKTLAALGANVSLPDHYIPYIRPSPEESELQEALTMPHTHLTTETGYIPTYAEVETSAWATGYFGGPVLMYDTSRLPIIPRATTANMISLLREIGVDVTSRNSYSTRHDHKDSVCIQHFGGVSNHAISYHTKKQEQDTKVPREPETVPLLSQIPEGELSSQQAVKRMRQLQGMASDRRRRGVRVLCLDGGGVRGLVQLEILRQMEERLAVKDQKITDLFDYIVGTSTGGIIALAMVYGGIRVRELQRLYLQMKKDVFTRRGPFVTGSTKHLERYLKLWLGPDKMRRMNSITHPKVLVSAVRRESTPVKLEWFSNFIKDSKSQELVWRVARCTSAAPFYFKPEGYYIDGGLLASNPSLHAVTTIQRHLSREGLGQTVSLVVSVGAGMNPPSKFHRLRINNALGRSVTFPLFMVNLIESHAVLCDASCQRMCVEQGIMYVRLNPSLVTEVALSETNNKKLIDMLWTTRKYMHQSAHHLNALKQFFMHYVHDGH